MAILARLAYGTPVHLNDVRYEGIEHLHIDDLQYARELGLGLKLIGTAERRQGGLSVRVHSALLYSGHPAASVHGMFNAVTVESATITEITMSGPGAGGRQTASAVLGDVVSVMTGGARPPAEPLPLPLIADVESAFYLHFDVADEPGVLAAITKVLGEAGVSIKSVVQRGLGEGARLVMVTHPVLSELLGATVRLKLEGANPTGSFKDRGMTCAVSAAVREGAKAVVCASTGNTAASAAAYAARAEITCAVIVPEGKIAQGKMAQ